MTTQADIDRWRGTTDSLNSYMNPSKNSLEDLVKMFRQGGGYGAGQNAIIDTQANQAQAKAASDAVASGMSSGSLAASTGARIAGDTANAKLGVEDTRTNYLAQAMQALSQMYGQYAGMNSQERMQQNQIKSNQSIANMNAGVSLMGQSQPRASASGFSSYTNPNAWGTYGNSSPDMTNQWGQTPNGKNSPQY